jgi:hypothetical protein
MVPFLGRSSEQDPAENAPSGLSRIVVDQAASSRRGTVDGDYSDQLSRTSGGERRGQFKASALPAVATAKVRNPHSFFGREAASLVDPATLSRGGRAVHRVTWQRHISMRCRRL